MVYNAKSFLIGWFIGVIFALLLWYRNSEYDRIYSIYSILIAVVLLILYGVCSGMNPNTAGKLVYILLWGFILVATSMVYVQTGMVLSGIVTLFIIIISAIATYYVLKGKYKIDITGKANDPPYWESTQTESFMIILVGIGLVLPLVLLLNHDCWANPILYVAILFIIISGSILANTYKNTQAISAWFYVLTILILFFWIVGMF